MKKGRHGFTLIEIIVAIVIIGILGVIGYVVISKAVTHDSSDSSVSELNIGNTQTVLDSFSKSLEGQFSYWSSTNCKYSSSPRPEDHCQDHTKDAIDISGASGYAYTMKLDGYGFYFEPEIRQSSDDAASISIVSPDSAVAQKVLNGISSHAASIKLSTDSPSPKLVPLPANETFDVRQTFFGQNVACLNLVTKESGTKNHMQLGCTNKSAYTSQAPEVNKLYQSYLKSRPQYANPEKTQLWLSFHSSGTESYTLPSKTSGYEIASVRIDHVHTDGGGDANTAGYAFFYAKGGQWNLLADLQKTEDLPCAYPFQNQDARTAFSGSECSGVERTFK